MSPEAPCPECGKIVDFHEDEMEEVEDGIALCAECGMRVVENAFVAEVFAGEHDDLVEEIEQEGSDGDG